MQWICSLFFQCTKVDGEKKGCLHEGWLLTEAKHTAFEMVGMQLMVCQLAAFLEVIHPMLGLVKTGVIAPLAQVRTSIIAALAQVRTSAIAALAQVRTSVVAPLAQVRTSVIAPLTHVRTSAIAALAQVRTSAMAPLAQVRTCLIAPQAQVKTNVFAPVLAAPAQVRRANRCSSCATSIFLSRTWLLLALCPVSLLSMCSFSLRYVQFPFFPCVHFPCMLSFLMSMSCV